MGLNRTAKIYCGHMCLR